MLWPQKRRKSTTPRKAAALSLSPFGSKSTGIEFSNRTQSGWNRFDLTDLNLLKSNASRVARQNAAWLYGQVVLGYAPLFEEAAKYCSSPNPL
jgi:hypothetical protein